MSKVPCTGDADDDDIFDSVRTIESDAGADAADTAATAVALR